MKRPRGTKRGYVQPSLQVPEEGNFNPYDYIDVADYRNNRRGKMQYEEDLAQIEYLAQLRQQEFALDYQDPKNEVIRMREAGLNPDLMGLSGATAPAAPTPNGGVDVSQYPTNIDQIQKGVAIINQVSSMTKDFLSGGLQLSNMFMQNIQTEASTLSSLFNLQDTSAYRLLDPSKLPLSRRTRRKLESLPSSRTLFTENNRGHVDFMNSSTSVMESNAKHWQHVLNPLFNPNGKYDEHGLPMGNTVEDWVDVWKPLSDWAYKEFGHKSAAAYSKSKSDDEYHATTDANGRSLGAVRGDREISSDTERGNQAEFMNSLREPLQKVAKNLKVRADKGESWASFALIALYFVSNLSFSSSSSDGPKGHSSSSSIGFGF